jgi:hypothetical protein
MSRVYMDRGCGYVLVDQRGGMVEMRGLGMRLLGYFVDLHVG